MIQDRKNAHLDICLHNDVEYGSTRLQEIHLISHSFPELSYTDIDTSCMFLHHRVHAPLFISCMTGGSEKGAIINTRLAESAETMNIPLGIGSMRILFEQESLIPEFSLKKIAPSVPFLANLGAAQLRHISTDDICSMLDRIQADAIVLHINSAQELCQKEGEKDFRQVLSSIRHFTSMCPIPVIVKEVGYGISPTMVSLLLGYGVHYVDVAGSGGTHWVKVEDIRNNEEDGSHEALYSLGHPTGLLMLALCDVPQVLASGGIRDAMDIARCLVLGTQSVGIGLPIIEKASVSTTEVVTYLTRLIDMLKKIMVLCNVGNIHDMVKVPFWIESSLQKDIYSFCKAQHIAIPQRIQNIIASH